MATTLFSMCCKNENAGFFHGVDGGFEKWKILELIRGFCAWNKL